MVNSLIYITGLLVWFGCGMYFIFYVLVQWWHKIKFHLWLFQIYDLYRLKRAYLRNKEIDFINVDWDLVYDVIAVLLSKDKEYKKHNRSIMRKPALQYYIDMYLWKVERELGSNS